MKRKMVSFILCIAMCMALAIPAFAVELSPYATDEVGNFSQMIEFAFSDNVEGLDILITMLLEMWSMVL